MICRHAEMASQLFCACLFRATVTASFDRQRKLALSSSVAGAGVLYEDAKHPVALDAQCVLAPA